MSKKIEVEEQDLKDLLNVLKTIDSKAARMTTGNFAHNIGTIRNLALGWYEIMKDKYLKE